MLTVQVNNVTLAANGVNDGRLVGSHTITGEPLVGGNVNFSVTVTNAPLTDGTYFEDRLYNVTGEIVLPQDVTFLSCSPSPSAVQTNTPAAGQTTLTFDNIKNLEVSESITINCQARLEPAIDVGDPFDIFYHWEANQLPDESADWRCYPEASDCENPTFPGDYATITAEAQAFDLEKVSNTNTGQYQVEGAGAYDDGQGGTGVDWPYTYTLTLTNNLVNPSNDLVITDILPPGVAYLSTESLICTVGGSPANIEPDLTLASGGNITLDGVTQPLSDGDLVMTWDLDALFGSAFALQPGETCTIIYNTAIPYAYRTSADTDQVDDAPFAPGTGPGPFSGDILQHAASHTNRYNASGDYDPPTGPDQPSGDGSFSTPDDDPEITVASGYHSIAKEADTSLVQQETQVNYSVHGWISEYYDFDANGTDPYIITDLLPNGLDFCAPGIPGDPTPADPGYYGDCVSEVAPVFTSQDPSATLTLVSVVQQSNFDLLVTWQVTSSLATADPNHPVTASNEWNLTYSTMVRDYYAAGDPNGNDVDDEYPVSGLDIRSNEAEASGRWHDRITEGRTGTDVTNGGDQIEVEPPQLNKRVWNGSEFIELEEGERWDIEVGDTARFQVEVTFSGHLDMRNLVIDDFLPRGMRYIDGTANFVGSADYPGSPQPAPGVGYSGTQYQAEQAGQLTTGGFVIDACPTPERPAGASADPFYTTQQFLGGLQDLVWYLCRVDNSDSDNPITWVVEFDALVVDEVGFTRDDIDVANFGNLSGTSSFGRTYSLRDNLDVTYHLPQLVLRKSNNAPAPTAYPGAFDYTIAVENVDDFATAYDWIIRDYVPAGVSIGANCPGFGSTVPGTVTCTTDSGVQAGTGGFVTIQPEVSGVHDPERAIDPGVSYSFTLPAALVPGNTPAETLRNTASVEYCSQPFPTPMVDDDGNPGTSEVPALWDHDANPATPATNAPARRCVGHLQGAGPWGHSDLGGAQPGASDFISFANVGGLLASPSAPNDVDDPASSGNESNNSDTSDVRIVALTPTKTHTPPVHDAGQTITDAATVGEVFTAHLNVVVPARTIVYPLSSGFVEINDLIDAGAVFCDTAGAHPDCVDPTITQSGSLVSSAGSPWWTASANGRDVDFTLNTIDNSASDSDYTFTINFTVLVTGDEDDGDALWLPFGSGGFPSTDVSNAFTLSYRNDNTTPQEHTTPPAEDSIDVEQPYMRAAKDVTQIDRPGEGTPLCNSAGTCNNLTVQGNDTLTYTLIYTNTGTSTAFDVTFVDWLPQFVNYNSDMMCAVTGSSPSAPGVTMSTPTLPAAYSVQLAVDATPAGSWDIEPGDAITCTFTVTVDPLVPTGSQLDNFTDVDWSTLDGEPVGEPERVYDDTDPDLPDHPGDPQDYPDNTNDDDAIERVPVQSPTISKVRTSPGPTGAGTQAPVRIGDIVAYQIEIPLPIGETHDLVVTDVLGAGLIYDGASFTAVTDSAPPATVTMSPTITGANDGSAATTIAWAVTSPNPIINDGTPTGNHTVIITFEAYVADVPANVHGRVIDNNVSAVFTDGFDTDHTIQQPTGERDDEEVRVVEPDILLTKTGFHVGENDTVVDAGDVIEYTVTITNERPANTETPSNQPIAYDLTWTDELDPNTVYVAGSMTCTLNAGPTTPEIVYDAPTNTLSVTNGADEETNTWDLAPGSVDTLVCTYQVTVQNSIFPNSTVDNTADADWSSQDGEPDSGAGEWPEREYDDRDRDGTGPTDDDGTNDADDFQLTVPQITVAKAVDDGPYQPGELIDYTLTVVLPEGTTEALTVVDTFDSANLGFESADAPVSLPAGVSLASGPTVSGNTITWVFNDIVHTGTTATANPPVSGYTITLNYTLRVLSAAMTATGADNTASAQFDTDGDDAPDSEEVTDEGSVDLTMPSLRLTKTVTPTGPVDAGDALTYTIRLTNAGPGTAYDAYFIENLDDDTTFDTGYTMVCASNNTGLPTSFQLDIDNNGSLDAAPTAAMDVFRLANNLDEAGNGWDLASSEYVECSYRVIVDDTVPAGADLDNLVVGRFDTADGDQPDTTTPDDNSPNLVAVDPDTGAPLGGESPDPTLEDEITLTAEDATSVPVPTPTLTKTVFEEDATGYQPGELVTYEIAVSIPEGQTVDLIVTDTVPTGFSYVETLSVVTSWGGSLTPTDNAAGGLVTWSFGNVQVPSANIGPTPAFETITIRFTMRVTGTVTDDATVTNTAAGTFDPPGTPDEDIPSDEDDVVVHIPSIQTDKVIVEVNGAAYVAGDTVDAGDTVRYAVTITNTDATATLYDVFLTDTLDDDTTYVGNVVCTSTDAGLPTSAAENANGQVITLANSLDETLNGWDLPPGASLTCEYDVTVDDTVVAGLTLTNTVVGTGSSADGNPPDEIDPITDDAETNIDVPPPTFTKERTSLPDVVEPGDEVQYTVTIPLPEGNTNGLTIVDTLPANFEFVSGSFTAAWGGALPALSSEPSAGATGTLTWAFGAAVVNPDDDDTSNDLLTLTYTVLVQSDAEPTTAPNGDGDDAVNEVEVSYIPAGEEEPTSLGVDSAEVDVAHPALVVDKSYTADPPTSGGVVNGVVQPGQVVTFTVMVTNVGAAETSAHTVVFTDTLPAGWTYVAGSSQVDLGSGFGPLGDPTEGTPGVLTWNLDALLNPIQPLLNGGFSFVLEYQTTAPDPFAAATYTNTVLVTANDGNGEPVPADNGDDTGNGWVPADTDPDDEDTTTLGAAAAITGVSWNDRDADGTIDGGEVGIGGVTIELYEAGNLVTPFATTTTNPDGSYAFMNLPPGDYVVREIHTPGGPIDHWESTADADTAATTGDETTYNSITVDGLAAGETRTERNFGNRVAGKVQGYVYLDYEGDGSNALPPNGSDDGLSPVTVTLYRDGSPIETTTTDPVTGFYSFTNLPDGTYTVVVNSGEAVAIAESDPLNQQYVDFTTGAVDTVTGLVVDAANNAPVAQAHFPFRGPAPLTITKTAYDLNGAPLLPGETIGWVICVHNPDQIPAPDVVVSDNIDTNRLEFVSGSIEVGITTTCPTLTGTPLQRPGLPAQSDPSGTPVTAVGTSVASLPSNEYVVLYFETTVKDPGLWSGGLIPFLTFVLARLLSGTTGRKVSRRAGYALTTSLLSIALLVALPLGERVMAQEATETVDTPAEVIAETPTDPPTEPPTATVTEQPTEPPTATATVAPTEAPTATVTPSPEATETAVATGTEPATATPETTETLSPATEEMTPEITATSPVEATPELTETLPVELTPELTETATPDTTIQITGRVFDDVNANLFQDEGEAGLPGVTVIAYDGAPEAGGSEVARVVTGEAGDYVFEDLPDGIYWLKTEAGTLPQHYVDVAALAQPDAQPTAVPVDTETDAVEPEAARLTSVEATPEVGPVTVVEAASFAYAQDTDGDGSPDGVEGDGDRNNDGVPNYLDPFDPSGVFYIDVTGNAIEGITAALYVDSNGDDSYTDGVDQLANIIQANPQVSDATGAYRFDIRVNNPDNPDDPGTGLPADGSRQRFFLVVDDTSLPVGILGLSTLVTDSGVFTGSEADGSGQIVPFAHAPNPPINTSTPPVTHVYYLAFEIGAGDDPVVNNHVAFEAELNELDFVVANTASASRAGEMPPVTDDDSLTLYSSLDMALVPNNDALVEPGASETYPHTLTNTGAQSDSYVISFPPGSQGWDQTLEIYDGATLLATLLPGETYTTPVMAPGEFLTLQHTITVPFGTPNGTTDTTIIRATSTTDPALSRVVTDITETLAACMGGMLYNDTDQSGAQDPGEDGIGGVTIYVYDATNALVATLTTAGDGAYNLGGLPSGDYRFEIDTTTLPEGTPLFVNPDTPTQIVSVTAGSACAVATYGIVLFDPAITKSGSPSTADPGDQVTFTITVTNSSTTAITGVVVNDPLVSYLSYISASGIPAGQISFNGATNTVTFDIGEMQAGEVITLTVVARVNNNAPRPGTINNTAIFSYNEGDDQDAGTTVNVSRRPSSGGDGGAPAPTPTPTPVATLTPVPGIVYGGGGVPSGFPTLLPATGELPMRWNTFEIVFGAALAFVLTFAVVGGGLVLVSYRRLKRSTMSTVAAGLLLVGVVSAGVSATTLVGMVLLNEPVAPQVANENEPPQVAAAATNQPTAVPTAGGPVTPVLPPATPEVALDEWAKQFVPPSVRATHLVIPALNVDTTLVEAPVRGNTWDVTGFTDEIAHLEGTSYPGMFGNAVIAGHVSHVNGFGPFKNLDRLKAGDIILAYGEGVEYRYVVSEVTVVDPTAVEVTYPVLDPGVKQLTLITCGGYDQATRQYTQRVIVQAEVLTT